MTSPTRLVWGLAGHPEPTGAVANLFADRPGMCVMCGLSADRTADAARATGANFTDQYLYRRPDSDRICPACVWCCSGKPPATLRMWTVVAAIGATLPDNHPKCWLPSQPGLCLTNRAAPGVVADILAAPPEGAWLVTVATSGQKHVLPYGKVNHGGPEWTVRMENTTITSNAPTWRRVLGHAATLRAARHTGDDLAAGRPTLAAIRTADDLDTWNHHHAGLADHVGSPLLDLALWCLTKETIHDHAHAAPVA
ncbi:hypothetical protein GCM10022243_48910 [Saccharothrix violaceirubra]|uniref:Uncharacterized protein n=1 Tax=Saccharothrix violaceirubra TaxID=413306 RepID=A0A7W7WUG3_9PSEU|nr:hypothetical protein [Saccharothrix violaceirubra]MBB4963767.1 hypothetical protein [Saccharothrix violaceirubra]